MSAISPPLSSFHHRKQPHPSAHPSAHRLLPLHLLSSLKLMAITRLIIAGMALLTLSGIAIYLKMRRPGRVVEWDPGVPSALSAALAG